MREWDDIWPAIDKISGMLHPGQERLLSELAYQAPELDILEVGALRGRSTASLAFGCEGTRKRVYSIDTFRGTHAKTDVQGDQFFLGEFLKNMDVCGLTDYVTPLVGFSSEYWGVWDRPLGLLFIDGGHDYETVRGDVDAFLPWLQPGCVLAMHDVWQEPGSGPDQVWAELLPKLTDCFYFHNLAYGRKV